MLWACVLLPQLALDAVLRRLPDPTVPLALATGAGAESRRQIGWVIVGGMSIGTLLTIFVVPTMYALLARQRVPGARTTPVESPHAEPAHGG